MNFGGRCCRGSIYIRHEAPMWYGWAIFDAFLAGLDHARRAADSSSMTEKK